MAESCSRLLPLFVRSSHTGTVEPQHLSWMSCYTCWAFSYAHETLFVLSSTLSRPSECKCDAVQLKKVEKKTHREDITGAITMTASDQLQMTDYVLKYYEDSDVEDT